MQLPEIVTDLIATWRDRNKHALDYYREHLAALHTTEDPAERAQHLDSMAGWADVQAISYFASVRYQWRTTATLLRAIAATERGCYLTNETRDDLVICGFAFTWSMLAAERDRRKRAARLFDLAEGLASVVTDPESYWGTGVPSVLDDIAASELDAIGAQAEPEHEEAAR